MGSYCYGYRSKLEYANKDDNYEIVKEGLPEFSYSIDVDEDIRGDSVHHAILFRDCNDNEVIEIHKYDTGESFLQIIVYDLKTRTKKTCELLPVKTNQPFSVQDCRVLNIEPTEEEIEKSKKEAIEIEDDDLPF